MSGTATTRVSTTWRSWTPPIAFPAVGTLSPVRTAACICGPIRPVAYQIPNDSPVDKMLDAQGRHRPGRADVEAADPQGYAGCCAAIRDMDMRRILPVIATPTLIIGGCDDCATPPPHSETLAAGIAGTRLVMLDAAHLSNVESPRSLRRSYLIFLDCPADKFLWFQISTCAVIVDFTIFWDFGHSGHREAEYAYTKRRMMWRAPSSKVAKGIVLYFSHTAHDHNQLASRPPAGLPRCSSGSSGSHRPCFVTRTPSYNVADRRGSVRTHADTKSLNQRVLGSSPSASTMFPLTNWAQRQGGCTSDESVAVLASRLDRVSASRCVPGNGRGARSFPNAPPCPM